MNDDLISRQAVLDAIEKLKKIHFDRVVVLNKVRDRALELPPVTPQEPKTGHWIRWYEQKENDKCIEHIPHCKCSECGKEYDPHSSQFIKFCNECGAKMVEPQESEEA